MGTPQHRQSPGGCLGMLDPVLKSPVTQPWHKDDFSLLETLHGACRYHPDSCDSVGYTNQCRGVLSATSGLAIPRSAFPDPVPQLQVPTSPLMPPLIV